MTDEDIIDVILKNEGGYTNNPNDRGGPTKYGITASDYGRWLGRNTTATADEVAAITQDVARQIYQKWYIADPGFGTIADDKLKLVLVDSGVLFGTSRAIKWLQQEVGTFADGKLGQATVTAVENHPAGPKLPLRVLGRRLIAVAQIVKSKPTQLGFLAGWVNRTVSLFDLI